MIMSKFKVGDKVRCVENDDYESHLTVGKVYTVLGIGYSCSTCFLLIKPDGILDVGGYSNLRFELVEPNPVLTPEEVFEHLRKGTKLQWAHKSTENWCNHSGDVTRIKVNELFDYYWRIKPEPEVIELNGKRYKLIEE